MQKFSTSAESIFIKIENRVRMVLKRSFLQYYEEIRRLGYLQALTPQAGFPKIAKWPLAPPHSLSHALQIGGTPVSEKISIFCVGFGAHI